MSRKKCNVHLISKILCVVMKQCSDPSYSFQFQSRQDQDGRGVGPSSSLLCPSDAHSNDHPSSDLKHPGGCMAEPGLPRPDDPDWFSKLSCISGQLGKAGTPGAIASITSSLTFHLLLKVCPPGPWIFFCPICCSSSCPSSSSCSSRD